MDQNPITPNENGNTSENNGKSNPKKSSSKTQTGATNNMANMQIMISHITTMGIDYKPKNEDILIKNLQQILDDTAAKIQSLREQEATVKKARGERKAQMQLLNQLNTSVVAAFKSTTVSDYMVEQAKMMQRKVRGQRSSTPPASADAGNEPSGKSQKKNGFDNKLDFFRKLIEIVKLQPEYEPNEPELQIATLEKTWQDMNATNLTVINGKAIIDQVKEERNDIMYHSNDSLVDRADKVKAYVKSIDTASGSVYRAISRLRFTRPKKK